MYKNKPYIFVWAKKTNTDSQTKPRYQVICSTLKNVNSNFYFKYIWIYIFKYKFKVYLVDLYILTQTYYLAPSPTFFKICFSSTYQIYLPIKFVSCIILIIQIRNPGANLWILPCLLLFPQQNESPLSSTMCLFRSLIPQCLAHSVWQLLSNSCSISMWINSICYQHVSSFKMLSMSA